MLLTYLDESYNQDRYLIAALSVPESEAISLTEALDEVVENVAFDHGAIADRAELHGYDMASGKGDWVGLAGKIRVRLGAYNAAMQAIADHDVQIVVRSVDLTLLDRHRAIHDHPHSITLNMLIERVDECADALDQLTLLIADEVDDQDGYRRDLWKYQRHGTWGYRSRVIQRIVDTIHFAPSHSSRLVQGADLIAYMALKRTRFETDERAQRANEAIWRRIESRIHHEGCWFPQARF